MKRDGVNRIFPFAKRELVNGVQDMSQKVINRGGYNKD